MKCTFIIAHEYKYYITIISTILSGVCVPYRCKDHSTSWGGHLIGKNFSSVGQKSTFKCKEGFKKSTLFENLSKSLNLQLIESFCLETSNETFLRYFFSHLIFLLLFWYNIVIAVIFICIVEMMCDKCDNFFCVSFTH